MPIVIQINGLKETRNLLINLDKNLSKEIRSEQMEFMKRVKKSAKLRAPRMTGRLAESINLMQVGKNDIILTVNSPYGWFQEAGFTPHWIHSGMSDRLGGTVGGLFGRQGYFFVKKFKPFILPAIETNLPSLPEKLSVSIQKAIRRGR